LRHAIQTRNARRYQARETVDEKGFQRRSVANTEIGQGLGVHTHAAAQPPVGDVLATKTRYLPRTLHALDRREKPQSQQDARIRSRMPRPSLEGFDRAEQRGQVQTFDKTPDRAHAMIVRHEFFQAHRTPLYLPPLSRAKPRRCHPNPLRCGLRGQRFEEFLVLVPRHR
jgi:hypothetical protein